MTEIKYRYSENNLILACAHCSTSVRDVDGISYCPKCDKELTDLEIYESDWHVPVSSYDMAQDYASNDNWGGSNWRGD